MTIVIICTFANVTCILEYRADEIGKHLKGDLAGYREIKLKELKDSGIRIVYEITGETVNILEVVKHSYDRKTGQ